MRSSIKFTPGILNLPGFLIIVFTMNICSLEARQSDREAMVDMLFHSFNNASTPGCAVSVIEAGDILYKNGYGMANLEYGVEISTETIFHVASVSKQFTALAVQLLVNEGKVSWDDDIRTYIPEVPEFSHTVSLRHLVHHVSGIRDQWSLLMQAGWRWESDVVTQNDVLDITSRQKNLNFEPGSRYLYSNTGYTLLAVVVERVSGQSLREFTSEQIFEPLGMNNTHFQDDHRRIVKNRAWAYESDRDGEFGLRNSIPVFDVVGASSLFTTVEDMAAWDRNMYNGEVGGTEGIEQLHTQFVLSNGDTTDYAHGLIKNEFGGLPMVSHGGADAGYRSQYLRFPEQQLSIAVFCNFPGAGPDLLARRTATIYLDDHLQRSGSGGQRQRRSLSDDGVAELTPGDLEKLHGIYVARPGDRIMQVYYENDRLMLDIGPGLPLVQVGDHQFVVDRSELELEIIPDNDSTRGTLLFNSRSFPDIYERHEPWSPSASELDLFAGTYYSDELYTEYRFEVYNDELQFHHRKLPTQSLRPVFTDAFYLGGRILVFSRDDQNQINGFRISDSRVWEVEFQKTDNL